jgi:hypothetical protein
MKLWRSSLCAVPMVGLLAACGADTGADQQGSDEPLAEVVPEGKADNYLSPTSMEYRLWGEGQITLDDAWADKADQDKETHAKELLDYKFKAYGHFINVYVTNKEHEDANKDYGGFSGLVRPSSLSSLVEPVDGARMTWTFVWEFEMGGPRDMLAHLPLQTRSNGERWFPVKLPALSESQCIAGSYPDSFDPSTYTGAMEEIEVAIEPEKESFDAWPEYRRLWDDGKLDMMILVGGDYNAERYDLKAAEQIFSWLKSAGFRHSAASYTDLTIDSPPFTKTIQADGKAVTVEVTLYHADIVSDDKLDLLRQKIVEAYEAMDVLIYDGHAGQDPSYSGVVYHYNPRRAISANDLAQLALPAKYQIFMFNGCKTYSVYPTALYASATKNTSNLDIISTVNFSWLTMQPFTTSGFINQLLAQKSGTHDPRTYVEILTEINKSANANVYYGVHGLDDNTHLNPYADVSALCRACSRDSDCPGAGNRCVRLSGGSFCAAECTADDGCPQGYKCKQIAEGNQIVGKQCLPQTYQCP